METAILLSTFNGELFLAEQLHSIFDQTYTSWKLIIRDDGSTDNTLSIINNYCEDYTDRIVLIKDEYGNVGAKKSYDLLLLKADAEYIAFADQDDVWKPEKLSIVVEEMKRLENEFGKNMPIMVHHDLEIANEKLEMQANSFYHYTGLSPSFAQKNVILWRNVIPGCAMLINKILAKQAGTIPDEAVMHDYWLVLFARFTGKIVFVPKALTIYRQHGKNSLGAEKKAIHKSWREIIGSIRNSGKNSAAFLKKFRVYQDQASAFVERFSENDNRISAVREFLLLNSKTSRLKRKWLVLKNHFLIGNFNEKMEQLFCC